IYHYKTIYINFTIYDLCRENDILKPKSNHCDILMLSPRESNKYPFYYVHVIGIFHVNVAW
ncbi:hypothetical protein J3R82DRAFT_9496, partial [Butyriboletus roseoflavus]